MEETEKIWFYLDQEASNNNEIVMVRDDGWRIRLTYMEDACNPGFRFEATDPPPTVDEFENARGYWLVYPKPCTCLDGYIETTHLGTDSMKREFTRKDAFTTRNEVRKAPEN